MSIDLSVVIPAYNASSSIVRSISSAVIQCEKNNLSYEIIVVNDGSKDDTLSIILKMIEKNPYIKVIDQQNSGPSAARNHGISHATGKYIALLDSDDEWINNKLELQLQFFKDHEDADLVAGQHSIQSRYQNPELITFRKEAFHNFFFTPTVVFKNKVKEIKFPENMRYSEDMRFFITIMLKYRCYYIPDIVSKNIWDKENFGESGLSGNLKMMEKGELSNIRFMYKNKKISWIIYFFAVHYSYLKYLRRIILSKIRKNS